MFETRPSRPEKYLLALWVLVGQCVYAETLNDVRHNLLMHHVQAESGSQVFDLGNNRQRRSTRRNEIGWVFTIRGAGPYATNVEARIAYLRFRFESDVTAFDRDTRRPESFKSGADGPGPEFLKLVDRPTNITLDANGRVTNVAGADELLAEGGEGVEFRLKHMMSAEAIRHWPMFAGVASAMAKAGTTWTDRFATGMNFIWLPPSDVRVGYRLSTADDESARIDVKYDVTPIPPPATTQPSIAEPPKVEADWNGTVVFDRKTGWLTKSSTALHAKSAQTIFGNINTGNESNVTFTWEQVDRSAFDLPVTTRPASQPAAVAPVDLDTRFQQGQALEYKIVEAVHANLRAGTGADKPIYFFREMGISAAAGNVGPDGSAELELSFLGPQAESLRLLASPTGSPQVLPSTEGPIVAGLTLEQYEQEPRHTANSMFKRLPLFAGANAPRPTPIGAKWGDMAEAFVPVVGKVVVDTQYELVAVDSATKTAKLAITQDLNLIEPQPNAGSHTGQDVPPPETTDYTGKLTGTAEWDLARGHCISARLTGSVTNTRKAATGEAVIIEETIELTMQRVRLAMPQTRPADEHRQAAGPTTRPEPALPETGPDGSPVIAYLGQRPLTINRLNDEMMRLLKNRAAPTPQVRDRMRRQARSMLLLTMAYESYLAEHPELVTAADLDKAIGQVAEIAKNAGRDLQTMLRDEGVSEASLRDQLRLQVAMEKVLGRANDPQRVAEFYNAHRGEFDGSTVVIRQIQYLVDPMLTPPAEQDTARTSLGSLRSDLDTGRVTFEQSMQKVAGDPLVGQVGQVPGFPRYGEKPEPLAAAAFAMQPGQIAGPIETSEGLYLIQMLVRMPGEPLTLEQATPLIQAYLQAEDARAFLVDELKRHPITWMAAASGKVPESAGARLAVPTSKPAAVEPMKSPDSFAGAVRPVQVPTTQPVTCSPVVTGADGTLVLAYVSEQAITQGEVDAEILRAGRGKWPDPTVLQNLRQQILADFVVRRVYERYAADHPGFVTQADIDATIQGAAQYAKTQGTSIERVMQESGRSMEELRQQSVSQIAREKFAAQCADDARIAAFYEAHKDGFDGTLVTAKHILVQVHPFLSRPEDNDAAKAKLVEIKREIESGKLTFDQAIEQYREDPTRKASPTLPPFPRYGRMAEPFAAAAFALAPGQITDPVRTAHGWHLIQVVTRTPGPLLTQAEINAVIRKRLYDQAFEDLLATQQITPLIVYVRPPQP